MINPVQANMAALRVAEQSLPAEVAKLSSKRTNLQTSDVLPQADTAEVSAFGAEYESYMKALRDLPDVRPDVVAKAREAIRSTVQYPPLEVIEGIGKLIGNPDHTII